MSHILRQKIKKLFWDDEGVALVVTLALFMFLYVSCAGVFAVGRAVKERILLQNAADAAAYSAAVVQADTLSRISAINRAMAWTYKDMIQRQHDYVLLTWLAEAYRRYQNDVPYAYGDEKCTKPLYMKLNGKSPLVSIDEIQNQIDRIPEIEAEIGRDRDRLKAMHDEEQDLLEDLVANGEGSENGTAKATVRRVLEANLSGEFGKQCLRKIVVNNSWWAEKQGTEVEFLEFSDDVGVVDEEEMDGNSWFPVADDSICRCYLVGEDENIAEWWYRPSPTLPPVYRFQRSDAIPPEWRPLVAHGEKDDRFTAKPIILKDTYFPAGGGLGAISVCVAHRTDNPWKFGDTVFDGLYDAFKPFSEHTRWARAVSSAQAGYRDAAEEGCYSVRWKNDGNWNLGTNDWDAVYVPVRKAFTPDAFKDMVESDSGWEKVLETGYDNLTSGYSDGINSTTYLPRMHNNSGSDNKLDWGADGTYRFLDLFFH